jgi:hypothetical protein
MRSICLLIVRKYLIQSTFPRLSIVPVATLKTFEFRLGKMLV